MLTYQCGCGVEYQEECILVADEAEYHRVRAQLPTPFSEIKPKHICFKQRGCGRPDCDDVRQVPILRIGSVLSLA